MSARAAVAVAVLVGAGVLAFAWRRAGAVPAVQAAAAGEDMSLADDTFDDWITSAVIFPAEEMTMRWYDELMNGRGAPYREFFANAEAANGIPAFMLARLAWQESHYRPDIINGQVKSSAGALGIMQIVPRWHPGVDPLNPAAAIPYAGRYLKNLYRQFGTWKLALMAYNWGPGNVSRWLRNGGSVPRETQNYHAQILADVQGFNPSPSIAWA